MNEPPDELWLKRRREHEEAEQRAYEKFRAEREHHAQEIEALQRRLEVMGQERSQRTKPLRMADALLSEDAIVIRTMAGIDVIVPKEMIRKLLTISQMAELAKLVPDGG